MQTATTEAPTQTQTRKPVTRLESLEELDALTPEDIVEVAGRTLMIVQTNHYGILNFFGRGVAKGSVEYIEIPRKSITVQDGVLVFNKPFVLDTLSEGGSYSQTYIDSDRRLTEAGL